MPLHAIPPVYDENCTKLILGSFPSVQSRAAGFFYHHPQNRFWRVLATLFDAPVPETIESKKAFLLARHIALWDVIASCDIVGSSDSSIRNVTPCDIAGLVHRIGITRIFTNGNTAHALYLRHCSSTVGINAVRLPSTSAANASWSLARLVQTWTCLLD